MQGNGTYISPLLVAVVGLSCCFEGQCASGLWCGGTNVVEHIVGCLERRANVGRSLLEDSPFDHCPVDRPCRPAGQGTDLGLGHLLERSQLVEEKVERQVGSALPGPAVLDRAVAHQPDHSHYALALPAASARFPPPSCVASILCGFP
jgi:hypothetical protein